MKTISQAPTPVPTENVSLSPERLAMTERLAEKADRREQQRLADGWTYVPQRDDKAKRHPCLVRYTQLPESEKQYDRKAMGTLRAVLALGCTTDPGGNTWRPLTKGRL